MKHAELINYLNNEIRDINRKLAIPELIGDWKALETRIESLEDTLLLESGAFKNSTEGFYWYDKLQELFADFRLSCAESA